LLLQKEYFQYCVLVAPVVESLTPNAGAHGLVGGGVQVSVLPDPLHHIWGLIVQEMWAG